MPRRQARSQTRARHAPAPLLVAAAALALPAAALAQNAEVIEDGRQEYVENCGVCHGRAATGEGPMAMILTVPPADLTGIAARNGGTFPFWEVFRTIQGTHPASGHMFYPMPVWGERFAEDEALRGGLPAHLRILVITHYLESIQEK